MQLCFTSSCHAPVCIVRQLPQAQCYCYQCTILHHVNKCVFVYVCKCSHSSSVVPIHSAAKCTPHKGEHCPLPLTPLHRQEGNHPGCVCSIRMCVHTCVVCVFLITLKNLMMSSKIQKRNTLYSFADSVSEHTQSNIHKHATIFFPLKECVTLFPVPTTHTCAHIHRESKTGCGCYLMLLMLPASEPSLHLSSCVATI